MICVKNARSKSFLTSYDPFIVEYCFNDPIQTAKDGYYKATLCQAAKARTVEEVVFELRPLCLCLSLKSDFKLADATQPTSADKIGSEHSANSVSER